MPSSMIDSSELRALGAFLDVSAYRTGLITSNMANIDTPGYGLRITQVLTGVQAQA